MMGLFLHPSSSWKTISSLSRRSLHQIHELVKEGGKRLEGKVPSPFLESEILLSHSLGIPRNQLFGPSSKDLMNNSIGFLEHFEEWYAITFFSHRKTHQLTSFLSKS